MHMHPEPRPAARAAGQIPRHGDAARARPPEHRGKDTYVDLARDGLQDPRLDGAAWRKSRHSNPSGNCVEIAELAGGAVAIRNSRHLDGPALICARAEFAGFLAGARDGDFDTLPC